MGSPPDRECLRYISDNLLVSDLNDVKFLNPPGAFDTSITLFDGKYSQLGLSKGSFHMHACMDSASSACVHIWNK